MRNLLYLVFTFLFMKELTFILLIIITWQTVVDDVQLPVAPLFGGRLVRFQLNRAIVRSAAPVFINKLLVNFKYCKFFQLLFNAHDKEGKNASKARGSIDSLYQTPHRLTIEWGGHPPLIEHFAVSELLSFESI